MDKEKTRKESSLFRLLGTLSFRSKIVMMILFVILIVCILLLAFVDFDEGYDEACRDIGFERSEGENMPTKCIGNQGYIDVYMDCKNLHTDCVAIKKVKCEE